MSLGSGRKLAVRFILVEMFHDRVARVKGSIYLITGADVIDDVSFEYFRTIDAAGIAFSQPIPTRNLEIGVYTVIVTVTDLIAGRSATETIEFKTSR